MYPHLPLAFSVRQGFYRTLYGAERGLLFPSRNRLFDLFQSPLPFAFELKKALAVPFSKERNTGNLQTQYTRPEVYCDQYPAHLQVPPLYVLDGVPVILIQNQCRGHNANFFCQFSCGEALECPMILQILARCGAFFIGFVVKGQMNHDFAFRIEVNPCVIEITIGKPIFSLQYAKSEGFEFGHGCCRRRPESMYERPLCDL